jgi:hypothetical protein
LAPHCGLMAAKRNKRANAITKRRTDNKAGCQSYS